MAAWNTLELSKVVYCPPRVTKDPKTGDEKKKPPMRMGVSVIMVDGAKYFLKDLRQKKDPKTKKPMVDKNGPVMTGGNITKHWPRVQKLTRWDQPMIQDGEPVYVKENIEKWDSVDLFTEYWIDRVGGVELLEAFAQGVERAEEDAKARRAAA